jgi:hypothetical protein
VFSESFIRSTLIRVIEKKKEQMIAPSAPGIVHGLQECLHFALRKKAEQRTGKSFEGNGHDPLGGLVMFRINRYPDNPAQRDEFSGPQCEMLDLLITPIAEAFRRVWTGRSFSPEGRFHSGLEQG